MLDERAEKIKESIDQTELVKDQAAVLPKNRNACSKPASKKDRN